MSVQSTSATVRNVDVGSATAFRGVVLSANVPAAAAELRLDLGYLASRRLEGALCAALTHDSYLYEHQTDAPHLTSGVLRALDKLGSTWLFRELAFSSYRRRNYEKHGQLSDVVAYGRSTIGSWVTTLEWLPDVGLFGRSVEVPRLPTGAAVRVLFQLIGVLCLMGEEEKARCLVAPFVDRVFEEASARVLDPVTLLQQVVTRAGLSSQWTFETTGPDHAIQFDAVLTDSRGRRAVASGTSKKAARMAAATQYLERYFPQTPTTDSPRAPLRPTGVPPEAPAAHRQAIAELAADFDLDRTYLPLLSQAFMHPSWTYENSRGVRACSQRDNQVLGFVGSHVLGYEFALATAHTAVADPPDSYTLTTTKNDTYAAAFFDMAMAPAALLGVGQRDSKGIETEIAANAFQAAMAAIFFARRAPRSLLELWPDRWDSVAKLIAPPLPRAFDPTTQFHALSAAVGLSCDYDISVAGPDHDNRYSAVMTISSDQLRRRLKVRGRPVRGKTRAKHEVAGQVIAATERLADMTETAMDAQTAVRGPADEVICAFLAVHYAATAGGSPGLARAWNKSRTFGAHLASQPQQLCAWAHKVDKLLDMRDRAVLNPEGLVRYFKTAMTSDETAQGTLRSELLHTLDWLANLESPADIEPAEVGRLIHLASAYRAAGADQDGGMLDELLLADWPVLHRGRVEVAGDVPRLQLAAGELALLDGIAKALTKDGNKVDVSLTDDGLLTFNPVLIPPDQVRFLIRIWGQVSPRLRLHADATSLNCVLPESTAERGPVLKAVERALRPTAAPLSAAIANLLHDLKNELTAASHASRTAGGGRTSELRRLADASEHLDEAKALAQRIRAATSLLGAPGDDSVPVSDFLRGYASHTLLRLPANISIVPSRSADDVSVCLDESSLRAVLDNLVKNAVEAMPGGGIITLDWTHDGRHAVLEVADDGPGLPKGVADALVSGRQINTSKPGGNGLGLVGVRTLLRRIGGSLEAAPARKGTRWHVTVPLAQATAERETDEPDPA
jgi:signal transduction histidine kinase/dsRNA-specific ribonuclease